MKHYDYEIVTVQETNGKARSNFGIGVYGIFLTKRFSVAMIENEIDTDHPTEKGGDE